MDTIWIEHSKYPGYLFSPEGNCLSIKNKKTRIMKPSLTPDGYFRICLNRKSVFLHRPVAEIFIKNKYNEYNFKKVQVNHIDGDKTNNNYKNLEWVTPKQNQRHSRKKLKNRCAIGELSGSSKLTNELVKKIIEELKTVKRGEQQFIAKKYNISQSTISMIKHNKIWDFLKRSK